MGGHQSTRRATFENESSPNVIKISTSMAERVKNAAQPTQLQHQQQQPKIEGKPVSSSVSEDGFYNFNIQTSLQIRQEQEQVLKKNDSYWENRLHSLEQSHEKINKIYENSYQEGVTEVKKSFVQLYPNSTPPCKELKKKVLECYKKHPNEPMRCAKEVKEFTECVELKRFSLTTKQEC